MIFRIENETEPNKRLRRISFRSMLAELPNFVVILILAIMSDSLIVWFDLLGSFSAELHSAFVFLITRKIGKIADDSWHFDIARLEVMTSFICDMTMIIGYLALLAGAAIEIPHPSDTTDWMFLFFLFKIIAVLFDLYFFFSQKKIYDQSPSKVNETETANWKNNLLIDVLIAVISVAVLFSPKYGWSLYISPVATVILSCCFIIGCGRRIKESFNELVNTAVPVIQQDKIIDILLEHRLDCVKHIGDIRCYVLDRKLHIAVKVEYKDDTTYHQQIQQLQIWKEAVNERYPESIVSVELDFKSFAL